MFIVFDEHDNAQTCDTLKEAIEIAKATAKGLWESGWGTEVNLYEAKVIGTVKAELTTTVEMEGVE